MSQSLASLLHNYAVESGEIPAAQQASPEEITVITDETQSVLEETISDLADTVEKVEDHADGAEKVIEAVESVESYVRDFEGLLANNVEISPVAVGFWAKGVRESLEARCIPAALWEPELTSAESSFESAEKGADDDAKKEAKQGFVAKGKALIMKLVNMVKAAGKAVIDAVMGFINRTGNSSKAVESAGQRLVSVAATLKGEAKGKVKSGGYAALVVGGKVEPAKAVAEANKVFADDIGPAQVKVTAAIALAAAALATKNPSRKAVETALNKAAAALPEAFTSELPGGSKMAYAKPASEGMMARFASGKFTISAPSAKAPEETDALSATEIKALGELLIKQGADIKTAGERAKASIDKAQATLKKVEEFAGANITDKDELEAAEAALKGAQGVISVAKLFGPVWSNYSGSLAKKAYAFGMASAAQYKGAEKAAAADGKGGEAAGAAA